MPGFIVVIPGSGVIRMCPVSVCHQVSMIGALPAPTCLRYHSQTSGLIGSPTLPRILIDDRAWACACCSPHCMCERIAVGEVYRIVTPYFSMMRHQTSLSGYPGTPSYSTD